MYHSVGEKVTLYSGTVTEAGQSSAFNVDGWIEGQVFVNVTAASGTLTLSLETGPEADDFYPNHTLITAILATGKLEPVKISNFGNWLRLRWVISPGGSFTFTAYGLFKS